MGDLVQIKLQDHLASGRTADIFLDVPDGRDVPGGRFKITSVEPRKGAKGETLAGHVCNLEGGTVKHVNQDASVWGSALPAPKAPPADQTPQTTPPAK